MKLQGIHHVAIIVSDYARSRAFYVEKLGLEVVREIYREERKDWKLDLKVDEQTQLEIFGVKNPPKRVDRPEAAGLRHLAFRVEDIEETKKELEEMGIEVEEIRMDAYDGYRFTFFKDPDGLPLELKECVL